MGFMGALGSAMGGMGMGGMRRPQQMGNTPQGPMQGNPWNKQAGGIGPSQGGMMGQKPFASTPFNKPGPNYQPYQGGMGGFAQNLGGMLGEMRGGPGQFGGQLPQSPQMSPMPEVPMGDLQGSMNQMQMGQPQMRGDRFRQMLGGGGMRGQM